MKILHSVISIVAVSLIAVSAFAQTTSGKLSSNDTWRGTVVITGDVTVPKNLRLVILPGTTVKFTPKSDDQKSGQDKELSELIIYGELIAEGTSNGQITFTSAAADKRMGDWYGIVIQNRKSTTSITQAVIEYAHDGIVIIKSNPRITSSVIQYNYNSGITCRIKSRPRIINNTIFANGWAGVFSHKKGNPVLTGNMINMNDYGVVILKSGKANLGWPSGKGADKNPGQNSFNGNTSYAVDNHSPNTIYAQNNIWTGPDNSPLSLRDIDKVIFDEKDNPGMGKVIYKPVWKSSAIIAEAAPAPAPSNNADNLTAEAAAAGGAAIAANQVPTPKSKVSKPATQKPASNKTQKAAKKQSSASQAPAQKKAKPSRETEAVALGGAAAATGGAVADKQVEKKAEKKTEKPVAVASPPKVEKKKEVSVPKRPVQEWQIDQKRRKYIGGRVLPDYPPIAAQAGLSGQVIIQVTVDEKGKVVSTKILKSTSDMFNESSLIAVKKNKYVPMTVNGQPVKVKLIERYVFTLK